MCNGLGLNSSFLPDLTLIFFYSAPSSHGVGFAQKGDFVGFPPSSKKSTSPPASSTPSPRAGQPFAYAIFLKFFFSFTVVCLTPYRYHPFSFFFLSFPFIPPQTASVDGCLPVHWPFRSRPHPPPPPFKPRFLSWLTPPPPIPFSDYCFPPLWTNSSSG